MRIRYLKLFLITYFCIFVALVALAVPVFAIADPDSPPQIGAVYVYEDLLEDDDIGVLVDYYLDYAATPNETATDAYMAVFIDTDGATQLKSVAPYTFVGSGYGRGLIWIYFTAAEVATYSIVSANETLYDVWLVGNPTLAWSGDPPKTVAGIDEWQTTGDADILLALRVLYYDDVLELIWVLDMIEVTALGNRLTAAGESYFENVIPNLRTIAPGAFAAGEYNPVMEDLDYSTSFGAIMTDVTGTVTGSPITLTEGANTVTVTVAGTFTLELERGTVGTVVGGTGNVTGSPVDIVYGANTVTVIVGDEGTLIVTVNLQNTQTGITSTVIGTGLDLTTVATHFGMSREMFSGLVWLAVSIIICAAVFRLGAREGIPGGGKVVMIVFDLCIVGGALLGLLEVVVAALMFIGFGAFTGYVLFFRQANV